MRWSEFAVFPVICFAVLGSDGCPPHVVTRIVVETSEPCVSPDDVCSLIEAIENANEGAGSHAD